MHIGNRVIVRDDSDNPYLVGTLIGFDGRIPIVEVNGKPFTRHAEVRKYKQELARTLDMLNPREQFRFLSMFHGKKTRWERA